MVDVQRCGDYRQVIDGIHLDGYGKRGAQAGGIVDLNDHHVGPGKVSIGNVVEGRTGYRGGAVGSVRTNAVSRNSAPGVLVGSG